MLKPSSALEEKKARFFVSSGLSCVHCGDLGCGSDSPVKELLSTYSIRHKQESISLNISLTYFTVLTQVNFQEAIQCIHHQP